MPLRVRRGTPDATHDDRSRLRIARGAGGPWKRRFVIELLLLGTAAAEGWPAAYCDCDACTGARRRGGPNIRTRSAALIDDDLKIDHGPDTVNQMQRVRRSLAKVRTILFTHQHCDHLYATDLKRASWPSTSTRGKEPIAIYGNQHVLDEIRGTFSDPAEFFLDLHLMQPLKPFTTPTGDTVLPLPAAHAPDALLMRITRQGKSILYGHDSGHYPQATLDALGDGVPLDVALFDCTHGGVKHKCEHHLSVEAVIQTVDKLRTRGAIVDGTRVIATHFSHNGGLLHEDLLRALLPHGINVAYDGMVVGV